MAVPWKADGSFISPGRHAANRANGGGHRTQARQGKKDGEPVASPRAGDGQEQKPEKAIPLTSTPVHTPWLECTEPDPTDQWYIQAGVKRIWLCCYIR